MEERDWERLLEQIQTGGCTPFLGAGASSSVLPTGANLSQLWARRYKYPFEDASDLADVMQYAAVMEGDSVYLKEQVAHDLLSRGEPDFTNAIEPHVLLARFPIPVYLTTNYDNFMTRALELAGKRPRTAICPWYPSSEMNADSSVPTGYDPVRHKPLVYHLHGRFYQYNGLLRHAESLVLTKEDYVEFLINLIMDKGMDNKRFVPAPVLAALTQRPLLFIGYSLRDWTFRTIFQGLLRTVAGVHRRRHVSIQLDPLRDTEDGDEDARKRAEKYLERYFDGLNISIYWGSIDDFCTQLLDHLEDA